MGRIHSTKIYIFLIFLVVSVFAEWAGAQDCSECATLTCGSSCFYTDPTTGLPASSSCGSNLFNVCIEGNTPPPSCSTGCPACPTSNFQCVGNGGTIGYCPAGPANCTPTPPRGSQTSNFLLQWNGQSPDISHQIGSAGPGPGIWLNTPSTSQGWLSYGPYTTIPMAGDYVAVFNLATDRRNENGLATLDVNDATTQTEITSRQPKNDDPAMGPTGVFSDLTLPFTLNSTQAGHQFEFRVWWLDTSALSESQLGYVPLQWNGANAQANPWHVVGQPIGTEWSATVGMGQNWFQYGPYITLDPGLYVAIWTLRIDDNSKDNNAVATIDVNDATTQTILPVGVTGQASQQILRRDFLAPQTQQVFYILFDVPAALAGHQFEFRVWYNNTAWLREEAFGVQQVVGPHKVNMSWWPAIQQLLD